MPTYEYRCDECQKTFDVVQSFHDEPLGACPTCGSPVRKVFGNVGIVFKGSGFYKTDSRTGAAARSPDGTGGEQPPSGDGGGDGGSNGTGDKAGAASGAEGGSGSDKGAGGDGGPPAKGDRGSSRPASKEPAVTSSGSGKTAAAKTEAAPG